MKVMENHLFKFNGFFLLWRQKAYEIDKWIRTESLQQLFSFSEASSFDENRTKSVYSI